uniref:Glycos_transf_1 domain-containing protein n=1 Tax=Macrostomum lignano TaxID=282301 RepID=A0A1I8FVH9_9PLAT
MERLRLIFVTKSDPDCGNYNTALRICQGLVSIRPTWSYRIVSTTADTLEDATSADVLLCLHLYRCASLLGQGGSLSEKNLKLIGIAGGTDLNEDSKQPDRRVVMQNVALNCRHIVVFSESMLQFFKQLMSEDLGSVAETSLPPVSIIPQGISISSLQRDLHVEELGDADDEAPGHCGAYFVIVGRIRPVKNCCSVLEPFRQWKLEQCDEARLSQVQLLFVGDIAMSLGVPTIVSAVPGNTDLVKHLETGFVFGNDEQLIRCLSLVASEIKADQALVQSVTESAKLFVQRSHDIDAELKAYVELIEDCVRFKVKQRA